MVKAATAERYANTRTDTIAADVGRRIRAARREQGMSLACLGGDDLSRSFLSLVELGRSRISLRALSIVAERLNLPLSYFLDDDTHAVDSAVELALDRAEAALSRQEPEECLRILETMAVPPHAQVRTLWLRSGAHIASGRARAALPVAEEGLALAVRRGDHRMAVQLRYRLGLALYTVDNYDEALVYFRAVIAESGNEFADPALIGKTIVCIGHILYVRDDVAGAIEHYARARDVFGSLSDMKSLACVYSGLSLAYERSGDLPSALRYSKLSLGTFQVLHNDREAAREMNNLAMRYREVGDFDEALVCARDAVARACQVDAHDLEAIARGTLAAVLVDMHDFEAGAREAHMADSLATDDTDLARIEARVVLGRVAAHSGDHECADELYVWALDALRALDHRSIFASTALAYSKELQRRGDTEKALEYALEAAGTRRSRAS